MWLLDILYKIAVIAGVVGGGSFLTYAYQKIRSQAHDAVKDWVLGLIAEELKDGLSNVLAGMAKSIDEIRQEISEFRNEHKAVRDMNVKEVDKLEKIEDLVTKSVNKADQQ